MPKRRDDRPAPPLPRCLRSGRALVGARPAGRHHGAIEFGAARLADRVRTAQAVLAGDPASDTGPRAPVPPARWSRRRRNPRPRIVRPQVVPRGGGSTPCSRTTRSRSRSVAAVNHGNLCRLRAQLFRGRDRCGLAVGQHGERHACRGDHAGASTTTNPFASSWGNPERKIRRGRLIDKAARPIADSRVGCRRERGRQVKPNSPNCRDA